MSFPAYNEYQQCKHAWLGNVPEHWVVAKTAWYFDIAMGQTILREDLIDDGEWPVFSATDGDHYFGRVNDPRVKLHVGDIVIPARGNSIGAVKMVKEPATTTQTTIYCKNLSAGKLLPEYVYHYLCGCRANLFYFTQTAIPQITVEEVGSNPILIPPLDEQKAISSFLDAETSKIDGLVSEQRSLIELLKEKRQAVISHAVTKGLNPNAPMKPSGIQWLGEVPEHWSVVPVKRVIEVKDGTHATPAYVDPSDESFPLITSKDFGEVEICFDEAKYISADDHQEVMKRSNTKRGDVLMSMIGGNIGKALIVETERQFSIKNVALFKTNGKRTIAKYLLYYLQSGLLDVQIDLLSRGGAQGFLGLGDLRNLVFFKVPADELNTIVSALDNRVEGFSQLLAEAERAIGLLQERRTALISAAVTGKIDVRNVAAKEAA